MKKKKKEGRKKKKLPDIWEDNLAAPPGPALSFCLLSTTALAENQCWATATVSPRSPQSIVVHQEPEALTSSTARPSWSGTRLDLASVITPYREIQFLRCAVGLVCSSTAARHLHDFDPVWSVIPHMDFIWTFVRGWRQKDPRCSGVWMPLCVFVGVSLYTHSNNRNGCQHASVLFILTPKMVRILFRKHRLMDRNAFCGVYLQSALCRPVFHKKNINRLGKSVDAILRSWETSGKTVLELRHDNRSWISVKWMSLLTVLVARTHRLLLLRLFDHVQSQHK